MLKFFQLYFRFGTRNSVKKKAVVVPSARISSKNLQRLMTLTSNWREIWKRVQNSTMISLHSWSVYSKRSPISVSLVRLRKKILWSKSSKTSFPEVEIHHRREQIHHQDRRHLASNNKVTTHHLLLGQMKHPCHRHVHNRISIKVCSCGIDIVRSSFNYKKSWTRNSKSEVGVSYDLAS
jgi:hypothetical protein